MAADEAFANASRSKHVACSFADGSWSGFTVTGLAVGEDAVAGYRLGQSLTLLQ